MSADLAIDQLELGVDAKGIGSVDLLSADEIVGWAWDPAQPDATIAVELLDGDLVIAAMDADQDRPDLALAGIGTGRYGFRFRQIGRALPSVCHQLRVRRAVDGLELPGSPQWVTNLGGDLDERASKMIEDLATAVVQTARDPDTVADFLALFVSSAVRIKQRQESFSIPGRASGDFALQRLQTQYPAFTLPLSDRPRVSIIIPVYNKFELTYACLRSIADNLPDVAMEILVMDDCSTDDTAFAGLLLPSGVRVLRAPQNSGFIAGCNRGAAAARGEFLFFLNNDTLMQPDWLDPLVATFDNHERIGIAGARLLFADGKVQDAGGIVWRMGDAWNWGRNADPLDPRFTFMRDVDYVTGAALLVRSDLFASLGGFDTLFAPAYYEDTDLAFRVRAAGFRVVIQPTAQIIHLEGASSGTDPAGTGVKRYQAINQAKFFRRWREVLTTHRYNGEQPEQEAERSVRKRAFFIDESVPTPNMDAGSNAALQHMLALVALGYKVIFLAADNMARIDPYTRTLESYGIECVYYPYSWSVEQVFRTTRVAPDLVYLHRFSNVSKYLGIVQAHFPHCPTLYSVADLQFLRLSREADIEARRHLDAEAETMRTRDLALMRQVDAVIVHSSYEAELLRSLVPDVAVHVLCWAVPTRTLRTPIKDRRGVAFIGGYQHRPNVDAALHLARDIMPLVREQSPGTICHLAGSRMPREVEALRRDDIAIAGFVPDLADLFNLVRCTVAPLRYGAGVKGKVLDSFSFGLPCVMSEVAAEGMDLPDDLLWLIASTPAAFAEKIAALHRDSSLAVRLSEAGLAFIARNFSPAVIVAQMGSIAAAVTTKKLAGVGSASF